MAGLLSLVRAAPLALFAAIACWAAHTLQAWLLGDCRERTDRALTAIVAMAGTLLTVDLWMRAVVAAGGTPSLDGAIAGCAIGMGFVALAGRRRAATPAPAAERDTSLRGPTAPERSAGVLTQTQLPDSRAPAAQGDGFERDPASTARATQDRSLAGGPFGPAASAATGLAHEQVAARLDAEDRAFGVVHAAMLAVVALTALRAFALDAPDRHLALARSILSGLFPPVYPYLPDRPIPYPYGFELVVAILHRLSGLELRHCFAIETVLAWAAGTSLLYHALRSRRQTPPGGALMGTVLAYLGGGLLWTRLPEGALALPHLEGLAALRPAARLWNPLAFPCAPLAISGFQHATALGLPIFLAVAVVFLRAAEGEDPGPWTLFAALLGTLRLAHLDMFALVYPTSLVVAIVTGLAANTQRPSIRLALALAAAGALGHLGGDGGVALAILGPPLGFRVHASGLTPGSALTAVPLPLVFGAFLVLTPIGLAYALWTAHREALLLLIAGVAQLALPPFFVDLGPTPAVAYFAIAQLALGVLAGLGLATISGVIGSRRLGLALAVPLALCGVSWGVAMLASRAAGATATGQESLARLAGAGPVPDVSLADSRAGEFLRPRVAPTDRILTRDPYLSVYSGLLTPDPRGEPYWAWQLDPDGGMAALLDRAYRDLDPDVLLAHGIRWLCFGPDDEAALGPAARASLAGGRFERLAQATGGVSWRWIYRVRGAGESIPTQVRALDALRALSSRFQGLTPPSARAPARTGGTR